MSESPELLESTRRALAHRTATAQVTGRAPSLVGTVIRGGHPVWTGGYGSLGGAGHAAPTGDTQYRIGSITKTFVAVLVMRLRDEGRLDLADPLSAHLPETADDPDVGAVTIAQLLSHTAGLASETPAPWWERSDGTEVRPDLADLYAEDPIKYPGGRNFHYSNTGFGLLGAVVGRLRGVSWLAALESEILGPLGMTRTTAMPTYPHADGYAVHPWADLLMPEPAYDAGLMGPAGQLWSTPADLAHFAAFLLTGSPTVLSANTLAEMRRPAGPSGVAQGAPQWDAGYGLGLQLARVHGRSLSGHTGSMPGFLATLWTSPADGLAAICFANATSGPMLPSVAADLIDVVATREPSLPMPWQPAADVAPALLALAGPWYWGANPMALRVRGDGDLELIALGGAGRASRFQARGDGTWIGLDGYYLGETLRAEPGIDGEVSHLDIGSFIFTRSPYPNAAEGQVDPVPGGVDADGWRGR